MQSTGATSWEIVSIDAAGQNTTLNISRQRLANNPWAYCTLEVYNIRDCDWLPPASSISHFTQMTLSDQNGAISPVWTSYTEEFFENRAGGNPCGAKFTINDPTSVDLQCQGASN